MLSGSEDGQQKAGQERAGQSALDRAEMALVTKGPMNADVLPVMLKRAKNRNSRPSGITSEIIVCE